MKFYRYFHATENDYVKVYRFLNNVIQYWSPINLKWESSAEKLESLKQERFVEINEEEANKIIKSQTK